LLSRKIIRHQNEANAASERATIATFRTNKMTASLDKVSVPRRNKIFTRFRGEGTVRMDDRDGVKAPGRERFARFEGDHHASDSMTINTHISRMSDFSKSTLNTFSRFGNNSSFSNDNDSLSFPNDDDEDEGEEELTGAGDTTTTNTNTNTNNTVDDGIQYPFFTTGGRKVIAQGNVLPPGMAIRHPSLLFSSNFAHLIKEFLYIWEGAKNDEKTQAVLAVRIRNLWIFNKVFKQWAKNAHAKGVIRARKLMKARIRVTVIMPGGVSTDLCVSPLVTGRDVVVQALKKRKSVSKALRHAKPKPGDFVLNFEGETIDDRQTLLDARVYERSTLVLGHPLPTTRIVR